MALIDSTSLAKYLRKCQGDALDAFYKLSKIAEPSYNTKFVRDMRLGEAGAYRHIIELVEHCEWVADDEEEAEDDEEENLAWSTGVKFYAKKLGEELES